MRYIAGWASGAARLFEDLKTRLSWPEFPPWIILLVGLLATGAGAEMVRQRSMAEDQARFDRAVERAATTIDRRLETYVALLTGAAGLMTATENVTPTQFKNYVASSFPPSNAGVQGFGFARWLGGDPGMALRLGISPWPNASRPSSAILALEPVNRANQAAMGFDMYSETVRRAAMDRARTSARPTASGKVTLVQELDAQTQPGFLIYVPVIRQRPDGSRRFLGWVFSPFRAEDLFNSAFAGSNLLEELDIEVYDGAPSPATTLFDSFDSLSRPGPLTAERRFGAHGRRWTLRFAARPEFGASGWRGAWPVIVTGIALTLSLAFASWLQAHGLRRARTAEAQARQAKERTELMLKEVNHRVANSLQLVASLLDLQRDAVADAEAKGALSDTRARVMAVARVHQRLYVSDEITRVDLCSYLSSLIDELESSLDTRQGRLKLTGKTVLVDTDKAVSAGVVVAELVTNAIKYAYPKNVAGEVRILVGRDAQLVRLSVEDDGVGLPKGGGARGGTGLGMRIVRAMVKNLDGQLDVSPAGAGARFVLTFPAAKAA